MKPKVSVIGIGRLGLSFSLLLSSKGYEVMGCDVNEKYVESLIDGSFKSKEPQVEELLHETKMKFTINPVSALNHSDLIFVFVPTPSKESGEYNHKYIDQVISKIEFHDIKNKTLVIGCTTMPGYCKSIQKKLLDNNIFIVYNPEFIAQGDIINGLKNSDIVLMGTEHPTILPLPIYYDIMDKEPNFKLLSLTSAEIAKISINCFLTMKIAFANLIGDIANNSCESKNVDVILDVIGSDSRVGKKYLSYGLPAGGVCLPRDQRALNKHSYFSTVHTKFLNAIDSENDRHYEYMVSYYKQMNEDRNVPFIFSYLGYKQGVDILTDSYQLKLCISLLREGYKVDVPADLKYVDMPEEFKDHVYNEKVTFGNNPSNGYKIN